MFTWAVPPATIATIPFVESSKEILIRAQRETVSASKGCTDVFVKRKDGPTVAPACCSDVF